MKVKEQLLGIYFIVILIPIIFLSVYLSKMLGEMVIDKSINEATVNIERIHERLDEEIKIANSVAEALYMDEKLEQILSTQYESFIDVYNTYNEFTEITTYLKHYKELSSIRIYTNNQTLLNNSQFIQMTPEIEKERWYQEALERGSRMEWAYKYDEYKNENQIALIRTLKGKKDKVLGVMVISLNSPQLKSIIKDEPYDTIIAFNDQIVVSKGNQKVIQDEMNQIQKMKIKSDGSGILKTHSEEGEGYVIFNRYTAKKTPSTEIKICVHMAVNALMQETRQILSKCFGIMLLSIILATSLIFIFIKHFSERIILVRREMAKVVSGDFNIRKSISGHDEIGELYGDIYQTVQSVQALVKEIYEEKVQKEALKRKQKEVEFEMLANQINPHFLYNTLETIRMKALCRGDVELARIVKMLSKLLRRNLEVAEKSVTLASELEMIKAYLEIQKFRFGERITYDIQCEVNAEATMILPLIIQPIIENAFIHGLEGKQGAGHIICQLTKQDQKLCIMVSDDGLGMTEGKLEKLKESLKHSGKKVGSK